MGIEELTKKLKHEYYKRPGDPNDPSGGLPTIEDKVNALFTRLRENTRYDQCSDDELKILAAKMLKNNVTKSFTNTLTVMNKYDGKPSDPVWDQFTYEEILGMANDGVYVPKEFLDWANAMADTDTTSYEIEDTASSDSNTASNMEVDTDDTTRAGQQKKLQKFASKADKQEELLSQKSDELQVQGKDLENLQSDLEANQKLTLDKIDKISKEFQTLSSKAQSGEAMTDEEIRRYKELGAVLNTQGQELVAQTKNVEADLEHLLSQMDEVNDIVSVNKSISRTLESLSLTYAGAEGAKNHSYSYTASSGLNTFGAMEAYAYAAQGASIASTSGMIGVKLSFDSDDLQFKLNANAAIVDVTKNKVQTAKAEAQSIIPEDTRANDVADNTVSPDNTEGTGEIPANGENASENEAETPVVTGGAAPVESTNKTGNVDANTTASADGATGTAGVEDVESAGTVEGATVTTETAAGGEMDPEEAAVREYLTGCTSKSSELQTHIDNVSTLKDQVKDIKQSRFKDTLKATVVFNAAFKQFEDLLNRVRGGKNVTDADRAEYERLNGLLNSETGSLTLDMQAKIATLNDFSSSVQSGLSLCKENMRYADTAIEAGKNYALTHNAGNLDAKALLLNKENLYDRLYGKAGESIGRDVIDSGEALAKQSKSSLRLFIFSSGLNDFASQYSTQLTDQMNANNEKVNPLAQEFARIMGTADEENKAGNTEDTAKSNTAKAQKEEASQDDVDNVENTGKAAEDQAKDAKKADKDAVNDKKKCDQDIKKNTAEMKKAQAQIKNLTTENELADAQIMQLYSQAQGEIQAIEAGRNINAQEAQTRSMNSTVKVNGGDNTSTEPAAPAVDVQGNIATLGAIAQQSQQLGLRVTSNGRTIKVLETKSIKADKAIASASAAKYKIAVQEQKEKEQDIKDNQKLTKTISDVGKVFTATKLAGMGLMLMPWSYPAGMIMFTIGKYGEIASYVTNAAINVAQGNLLGAAINIGAAALSFASAPPTSAAATEGVKEGAKAGAKSTGSAAGNAAATEGAAAVGQEVGTEVGTEVAKDAGAEVAKDAGAEVAKDAGAEVVKDAGGEAIKEAGTEVAKDAGTEVVKETGAGAAEAAMPALSAPVQSPVLAVTKSAAAEGVEESMKAVSKQVSEEMAKEVAKQVTKEQIKVVVQNTLLEAAKQTLLAYGDKVQQKDTKEETNRKVLVQFERKKRDAMKRGVEKIKKSMRAR